MRHPLRGVAAIAASIALLAPVASAGAKTTKSYCHPGGDYCVAVIKHEGMTKLRITTPSLTSNYGLCVRRTVNGTHECHHFRFKQKAGGLQESRVDVQSRFGGPPSGHYCATWRYGGAKLHTLCFNYTRLLSRGL